MQNTSEIDTGCLVIPSKSILEHLSCCSEYAKPLTGSSPPFCFSLCLMSSIKVCVYSLTEAFMDSEFLKTHLGCWTDNNSIRDQNTANLPLFLIVFEEILLCLVISLSNKA